MAGVVGLWWGLPPAPRYGLTLPPGRQVVGVSPDGVAVAVVRLSDISHCGPLEAWDVATGRRLWSDPATPEVVTSGLSADGRHARCYPRGDPAAEFEVVAATGERVTPARPFGSRSVHRQGGSAVWVETEPKGRFDLHHPGTGQRVGTVPAAGDVAKLFWPLSLSDDGRLAVLAVHNPDELHLYDAATGELLGRQPRPPDQGSGVVLADGRVLVGAELWSLRTGERQVLEPPATRPDWGCLCRVGDRWLVATLFVRDGTGGGDHEFRWYDLATGREEVGRRVRKHVSKQGTSQSGSIMTNCVAGTPTGRFGPLLTCCTADYRPAGAVNRWLARLPGLAHLRYSADVSRWRVVDAASGRVLADQPIQYWPYRTFWRVTADGLLYTSFPDDRERIEAWDLPPRPSRRLVVGLAVGWAAVLGLGPWLWRRVRRRLATPAARPG